MIKVRICEDLEECHRLWKRHWPVECLFDLWPVRSCFGNAFNRPAAFLVAEENGKAAGLLTLSWIEETRCFGHFPGETWHGKTWLEQNKMVARNPKMAEELLKSIPGAAHLRYMTGGSLPLKDDRIRLDETGYLFLPGAYNYSFETYLQTFSGKSRKKINGELARLAAPGVTYRYDCLKDVAHLFSMNLEAFGRKSYFSDPRFLKSFETLVAWFHSTGMLRVTTVMIGGRIAAVDMGVVWKQTYTLLAGATHPEFPGVAKLINFHHMEWACTRRFKTVDFLCGDFGWKERFHLTPRPLYELRINPGQNSWQDLFPERRVACA